ncbi:MAG: hypothetical protein PHS07_04105 [Patescibacteria group bacterium]|jgi:hypothetical protein|nr:hypothetical protein [Patescibacteria group bacterium]
MSQISNEIFAKIKERMKIEGTFGREEYEALIEELMDEYSDQELITDDDDVVEIEEDLKSRWEILKEEGLE